MPKNGHERNQREQKIRAGIITATLILGLLGILLCGYGHAAMSTELYISGVGTVVKSAGKFWSEHLQDMTVGECAQAEIYTQKQMIDKRDNKAYWIIKYKDGNCWMAQDLRLQLSNQTYLTPVNSDVNANWRPSYNTINIANTFDNTATGTRSYDFGEYISTRLFGSCGSNKSSLADCPTFAEPVGTRKPSSDPNFYMNNGNKTYTDTEYDAHHLFGIYYQYNTATAGVGGNGSVDGQRIDTSICPKGWKLPTGIIDDVTTDYYNLATLEGVEIEFLNEPPFYYLAGGYVSTNSNTKLTSAGASRLYWTSNINSKTMAYGLINYRLNASAKTEAGFVRCVFYGK